MSYDFDDVVFSYEENDWLEPVDTRYEREEEDFDDWEGEGSEEFGEGPDVEEARMEASSLVNQFVEEEADVDPYVDPSIFNDDDILW